MNGIVVVGGGISGLCCAWRLRRQGFSVTLLERGRRFGGVIDTVEKSGFRFDIGPQSFLSTAPMRELIGELGLAGELLQADPRAPRYILFRGRLTPAPLGPLEFLRSPLIGWRTKLRLLFEPLGRTRPPEQEESIAQFVRRKAGEDLLDNLVAPFVSGIYAGDPEKLSLASAFPGVRQLEERYGSLVRGLLKSRRRGNAREPRPALCNFRPGLSALIAALADTLGDDAVLHAEITALHRASENGRGGFHIEYNAGGASRALDARALIVATPAPEAARLLAGVEPRLGEILSGIEYAPVAQVSMGYLTKQISWRAPGTQNAERGNGPQGFGFLVPRADGLRTLGTVWNSCLFPGRAPGQGAEAAASFTSFLGGASDPCICELGEEEIARIACAELAAVLGIAGEPLELQTVRWQRALPQYNLGHAAIGAAAKERCSAIPDLFITGNYLAGPSLGACVEEARTVADSAAAIFSAPGAETAARQTRL